MPFVLKVKCCFAQVQMLGWWLLTALPAIYCISASQAAHAADSLARPAGLLNYAINEDGPERPESRKVLHRSGTPGSTYPGTDVLHPANERAEGNPLYNLLEAEQSRRDLSEDEELGKADSYDEAGPTPLNFLERLEHDTSAHDEALEQDTSANDKPLEQDTSANDESQEQDMPADAKSLESEQGLASASDSRQPTGQQAYLASALRTLDPRILSLMADSDALEDPLIDRHALRDLLTSRGFQFSYQSACTADRVGWVLDPLGPCCGFYCIGVLNLGIHFACPPTYCFQHPTLNSPLGVCNPCPSPPPCALLSLFPRFPFTIA